MGASKEVVIPLRDQKLDCSVYGSYLRTEEVEREATPAFMEEWYAWLEAQRDPGCYEAYKVIRDGEIVWVTDVFMPKELCSKLKIILEQSK